MKKVLKSVWLVAMVALASGSVVGHMSSSAGVQRETIPPPAEVVHVELKPINENSQQGSYAPKYKKYSKLPRFTQGLVFDEQTGTLFESVGWWRHSSLIQYTLDQTQLTSSYRELSYLNDFYQRDNLTPEEENATGWMAGIWKNFFAEGLALVGNSLIQFSWRGEKYFVYKKDRVIGGKKKPRAYQRKGEGWGATVYKEGAKEFLLLSDGSSLITFYDAGDLTNLKKVGFIEVVNGDRPVSQINELEMVGNKLLANVFIDVRNENGAGEYYNGHQVLVIDPKTGYVEKVLQFHPDHTEMKTFADKALATSPSAHELACPPDSQLPGMFLCRDRHFAFNGIAYDSRQDLVYFTGKNWPYFYEFKGSDLVGP
ncbi:MAG: glutaminyl-peptide cyclotransferase [Bdellovibrionaceae bacterium]|nr:glutaminyl-peptide cyclotransferase [Bdellovibrionales bacterium]MCB9086554.1 glutaminyl-peptide cyclotransferase [Pseudobdellovibrionaceae bacterium]